jgi:hypothetical protein
MSDTLTYRLGGQDACEAYLPAYIITNYFMNANEKKSFFSVCVIRREFFRSEKQVLGGAARATPGPPKTPILGLPKSRPSPLQKCAKKCVFG